MTAQESRILATITGFIKSIDDKFTQMSTELKETKAGTYKRFDSLQADINRLSQEVAIIKVTTMTTTACQEKHEAYLAKCAPPLDKQQKPLLLQFSASQIWSYGGVIVCIIAVLMGAAKAIDLLLAALKLAK